MEENTAVRLSPLHAVVFACIFQDRKKAGSAMLEFLNAILSHSAAGIPEEVQIV